MSQAGVSGRFALFRETDFVRLWVVGGIGEGVRWMQILAMSVYAYDVTGSVLAVTAVNFLRSIPLLLFGAVMGALADRMDGRRLLVLSVIIPGSATLAIGVLGLLARRRLPRRGSLRPGPAPLAPPACRGQAKRSQSSNALRASWLARSPWQAA